MGRPARIWFPGALYHIILRGDNREVVFFARRDYLKYLKLLAEGKDRFRYHLLAYALMSNHIHLMIETGQTTPIWKIMHSINTAYTLDLNFRYQRVGHIFQGRYKSILVDKDSYCLELTRYIHLNPIRAHLCAMPEDYEWSSYRHYVGLSTSSFIDNKLVLAMISPNPGEHISLYRQFVEEGIAEPRHLEREIVLGQFLGSEHFVKGVLRSIDSAS